MLKRFRAAQRVLLWVPVTTLDSAAAASPLRRSARLMNTVTSRIESAEDAVLGTHKRAGPVRQHVLLEREGSRGKERSRQTVPASAADTTVQLPAAAATELQEEQAREQEDDLMRVSPG